MQCPKCAYKNNSGNKFCGSCGSQLALICPDCSTENPPDHRFCGKCGTALLNKSAPETGKSGRAAPASDKDASHSDSEVRHLTLMFCDLVGSTALSASLDPEEFRLLVREYQSTCEQVISRYEGYIAQYLGDGLLVYFGYPIAHEDDAMRAVHSGLGILAAMEELNKQLEKEKNIRLEVRIGVHSGMVVVGDVGTGKRSERLALGEATNIAARIEAVAEKGTLAISQSTLQLVRGLIDTEELGAHTLKGIAKPLELYRVIRITTAKSRLDIVETTGMTPLVGRQHEMSMFLSNWEKAKRSYSQVILLSGSAGVGKSRLLRELTVTVSKEKDVRIIRCFCSPYHQNSAFYPVIDMMDREIFQIDHSSFQVRNLNHIEAFVRLNNMALDQVVPLFAELFSIKYDSVYKPLKLTPEKKKQRTVEALMSTLLQSASKQPLLLIIEDLHWMDASTLELVNLLLNQSPTHRILTVLTFRPEFISPWGAQPHFSSISLGHLPKSDARAVVVHIAQSMVLPDDVIDRIVAKTDGIPLFVEELTKSVMESRLVENRYGDTRSAGSVTMAIPETLHDALTARLDRLGVDREIAQMGATIGREFSFELYSALREGEDVNLEEGLTHLVSAGLLDQRGVPPTATYQFKHALIQDVAYQSLVKSKRRSYHKRIAHVLVEKFADRLETRPELIAHHYTEAGLIEEAVPFWFKAGTRSSRRFENVETIAHLSKGLELLLSLPESEERDRVELDFRVPLSTALSVIRGYGSNEVRDSFSKARSLCLKLGRNAEMGKILWGLGVNYVVNSEYNNALEVGTEHLKISQEEHGIRSQIAAHLYIGGAHFGMANFEQATEHFSSGSKLYVIEQHDEQVASFGMDMGVFGIAFSLHPIWHLGRHELTIARRDQAIALAEKLDHPFTSVIVYDYCCIFHQLRREPELVRKYANAAKEICKAHTFDYYLGWAMILSGWALAALEDCEKGLAEIQEGLDKLHGTDGRRSLPYYTALLAEAYRINNQNDVALETIVTALELVDQIGESWWEAELYRLRGEILLSISANSVLEAETSFETALNISRKQKSISLELRAATSMSRLWRDQGKSVEAKKLITETVTMHTEGFDTLDYKDAMELADSL